MKKKISILGSTGSIGLSTLKIINKKRDLFKIYLLSSNKNFSLINKQINKYKPEYFIITNYQIYKKAKEKFKNKKTKIFNNFKSLNSLKKSNYTIAAIPGLAGLEPTMLMTKFSKKILIANKESVICGWKLIKEIARKNKTIIVPIDSEHFSIFKLLKNQNLNKIEKIFITASGGPFLNFKKSELKKITPQQAVKHPKWKMGKKISIDSSTLMNKILETIEAQKLFDIPEKKIEILIHPDSLVHAIVKFKNGLVKFIYHDTSMLIPLANALFEENVNIKEFYKSSKKDIQNLTFQKVNSIMFPVIKLKKRANEHPSSSIIINAVNEILVDLFLKKKIDFLSISKTIMSILNDRNYKKYAIRNPKNIEDIIDIDQWARNKILRKFN